MGRHWQATRGLSVACQVKLRRAVRLADHVAGCAIVERPDGDGWMAFIPVGRAAPRFERSVADGRLIGVYRMTREMGEATLALRMLEDIKAAMGVV